MDQVSSHSGTLLNTLPETLKGTIGGTFNETMRIKDEDDCVTFDRESPEGEL